MSTTVKSWHPVFLFHNMLSAIPTWLPIRIIKTVRTNPFTGRYVNKLIFPKINAAVRRAFFICGKEDEVAGFKFSSFLDAFAEFVLLIGSTGNGKTVLLEDILDEA